MALLFRALLVGCLLALFVRTYLVQLYRVPSDSMMPGLLPGDHVVVDRFLYGANPPGLPLLPARPPRRFEVVVLERPGGRRLIKRLLGLPGERIEVRAHRLLVDGKPLDLAPERLLLPGADTPAAAAVPAHFGPLRLGDEQYLVLGDQRGVSLDSRSFGPVEARELIGRAILIYWSIPIDFGAEDSSSFAKIPGPTHSSWVMARWNRCLRPLR